MVPVVSSLVTGIPVLNISASRRQWRRRADVFSGDSAAEPPLELSQPSKIRSTAKIRRYPFGCNFAKEPLTFINLEPVVLWRILKICFLL
jgi:hypothetical protein